MLDPFKSSALSFQRRSADLVTTHCFAIRAAAQSGVMPRVLELFAKRGLVPSKWHSAVVGSGGEVHLQIDIQMTGLEHDLASHIARSLRQIVHVDSVLTTTKATAAQFGG